MAAACGRTTLAAVLFSLFCAIEFGRLYADLFSCRKYSYHSIDSSFSESKNGSLLVASHTTSSRNHTTSNTVVFKGTLTILIGQAGSCPKGCAFIHHILPHTLRYRYAETLTDQDQHVLLVARSPLDKPEYQTIVDTQRRRGYSIGLFLMGDEHYLNTTQQHYGNYDYVLRHYYDSKARALGNMTCGMSAAPLPIVQAPKWGVHWTFIGVGPVLGLPNLVSMRHAAATWPIEQRPINCTFIGRSTDPRQKMKEAFEKHGSDLLCDIVFTPGFKQGADAWDLVVERLTMSKIGLNPTGNNPECHRLPELLESGVVPAMIENEHSRFVGAAFRRLPGILGESWPEVIIEMRRLLDPANLSELALLQDDAVRFYSELKECMRADLAIIFSNAFLEA